MEIYNIFAWSHAGRAPLEHERKYKPNCFYENHKSKDFIFDKRRLSSTMFQRDTPRPSAPYLWSLTNEAEGFFKFLKVIPMKEGIF